MLPTMSRKLSLSRWKSTSIRNSTAEPPLSWTEIGPAPEHLAKEVERLYWEGARAEIENIIRTLQIWRRPEYAAAAFLSDNDDNIHGYDTFLDQVGQQARSFAIRHRLCPSNIVLYARIAYIEQARTALPRMTGCKLKEGLASQQSAVSRRILLQRRRVLGSRQRFGEI